MCSAYTWCVLLSLAKCFRDSTNVQCLRMGGFAISCKMFQGLDKCTVLTHGVFCYLLRNVSGTGLYTQGLYTHGVNMKVCVLLSLAECFKDWTDVQWLHGWQKVLNPELRRTTGGPTGRSTKGQWTLEEVNMMRYCGRLFNDSRERTGRKLQNVSGTGQMCSAYTWCVLLSLAKCFRDSTNVQCLRMGGFAISCKMFQGLDKCTVLTHGVFCYLLQNVSGTRQMYSAYAWGVLLSLAECFRDWSVHTRSIYTRCEYESLCVLLSLAECFKDWTYVQWLHGWQKVLNPELRRRTTGGPTGRSTKGQWTLEEVNMMRYCGRLFNDSRERTGRKLQNVSGTGQMCSAYTCKMFQGLDKCTVLTHGGFCYLLQNVSGTRQMYSAYAWGVLLSLAECFRDWSVHTRSIYTRCEYESLCVLLSLAKCFKDWTYVQWLHGWQKVLNPELRRRTTGGPTGRSTKGQWTLEEVNMMRYCGRLFNDSRERTGRKLQNVSGTGQMCSAYTCKMFQGLDKCTVLTHGGFCYLLQNVSGTRQMYSAYAWGVLLSLAECFRDWSVHTRSIYTRCEYESLCVLLSLAKCFKDWTYVQWLHGWQKVLNPELRRRTTGGPTGRSTKGQWTLEEVNMMRYCGRLFNDSRERTGRKLQNVSGTGQMCSAYTWCVLLSLAKCFRDSTNVQCLRMGGFAISCKMFQGLDKCTVLTHGVFCYLLRNVSGTGLYTQGLYTHGVNMKVCVFCYLLQNVSGTGQMCSAYTCKMFQGLDKCTVLTHGGFCYLLQNVSGTRQMYSAYAWGVLLSLAECFRDWSVHTRSIYTRCEYESLCVLLSLAECFKDWTDVQWLHGWQKVLNPELRRGKSSQSRNWGMQLYLFDKQLWKMKDNIYSFRVCNFCYGGQRMQSLHGRTTGGPTGRSTKGQWTLEEVNMMRYCGRLFNDSRERTGRKLFVCFSAECFRDWTNVQCLHMQNVSGTRQMYSAYALGVLLSLAKCFRDSTNVQCLRMGCFAISCKMFQGLDKCTVLTHGGFCYLLQNVSGTRQMYSAYAWGVLLSLAECFRDWSVHTRSIYTRCEYESLCVLLSLAECFKDWTDVQCLHGWQKVLNPELRRRTTGGPTARSTKGQWTLEVVNMMRYCGRLFNDSRERTRRKLRNVSGTGQMCSAYTWCVLLSLAKCFRDSTNVQCLRMGGFAISCKMFQGLDKCTVLTHGVFCYLLRNVSGTGLYTHGLTHGVNMNVCVFCYLLFVFFSRMFQGLDRCTVLTWVAESLESRTKEVPAVGILISCHTLSIDESSMTEESKIVHKDSRDPFIMSGCKVADDNGIMLVTSVGANTEWGMLMAGTSEDTDEKTPLQMTVVEAYVGEKKIDSPDGNQLSPMLTSLLIEGIAQNTTGSIYVPFNPCRPSVKDAVGLCQIAGVKILEDTSEL
ncbi:uncharacterized protein LOC123199077 [Mangifera indica]|uniref:uncharacterized protein LOC123199077 n=1 Tax=Mangifera indica TaxID=29780 RepID=UPI001CFADB38|nr:uncharacterized protein LOC123199077 [Mangifera indica]